MKIGESVLGIGLLAAAALVGPGISVASAVEATPSAWPEDCRYYEGDGESGYARCSAGGGHYRVVINCHNKYDGKSTFYYGVSWKTPGNWSVRYCPEVGETIRFVGIDTKAT